MKKCLNLFVVLSISFMSLTVFAKTSLQSVSLDYTTELFSADIPQSIQKQLIASNIQIREKALESVIRELENKCLDSNSPNANQMDIVSVDYLAKSKSDKELVGTIKVEAICRSSQ